MSQVDLLPPSTRRFCPVIYEASSLDKNITAFASSSGVPNLFSVVRSSSNVFSEIVLIVPGDTQFTVIPLSPTSLDEALVKEITAPLVIE